MISENHYTLQTVVGVEERVSLFIVHSHTASFLKQRACILLLENLGF